MKNTTKTASTFAMAIAAAGCLAFAAIAEKDVRTLDGVPQLDVKVGGFWRSEFRKLSVQWLPHCIRQMEKGGRGEEMLNLVATAEINAGKKPSVRFKGCPWSDAYPFNTVESICLALEIDPGADAEWRKANDHLRAKLEEWIPKILAAQEPSGATSSDDQCRPHAERKRCYLWYNGVCPLKLFQHEARR